MIFDDRRDAGRKLALRLKEYENRKDVVVLGLARGGVVVANEIARELHLPLSIVVVRKVGAPDNEELALGAVTETGDGLFNQDLVYSLGVSKEYLLNEIERQKKLAQERVSLYHLPKIDLKGKTVILVDDGIATGASMRVAIHSMKAAGAAHVIVAVPVAAPDSLQIIEKTVDKVICLYAPLGFEAVGQYYRQFNQTTDQDIIQLLAMR